MGRVSGMEISSFQGLKKPLKISPREESYSFPRANFKISFNPRDKETSIHETYGLFVNCIPIRVNQAIFLFYASIWRVFSNKIKRYTACIKKLSIAAVSIFCLCGNQISTWVIQKSGFFSLVQRRFHEFENVWKFINDHRLY